MRLRARDFILFTLAFASAVTVIETSEIPPPVKKSSIQTPTTSSIDLKKIQKEIGNPKAIDLDHGVDKRSAEVYPGDENNLDTPEKRARVGFTGMRGKKEYTPDDYCGRRLRLEGVLNKRFFRNFNELFGGKRATLSFHGMRGKKSQDYENELMTPESYETIPREEFLINSGLIDNPDEIQDEEINEEEEEELAKRSPYAFQGMRGKKEDPFDMKRAMGFLGMRGKKETEIWDSDYKRAPQASFFGMKGKKAQSGFFGMRGKKASPNAFFGIKGKREPETSVGYIDFNLPTEGKEEPETTRNRFRRGITWLNNSKKAKNAFFGLRGKKSTL